MINKENTNSVKNSLLFLLLLFLTCLDSLFSGNKLELFFKHVDEVIVIALLCYILLNISFIQLKKPKLLSLWCLFILVGVISSTIFRYQDIYATIIDCVLIISKFMIGYLAVYVYILQSKQLICVSVYKCAKLATVVLFSLAIHDLFLPPFFEKADYRYFTYSLKLMFPHPTYLAATGIFLLIYFGLFSRTKGGYIYMFMASTLAVLSFRGKAIGFVLAYWMFYLCVYVFKSRHYFFVTIIGGLASLLIVIDQLNEYFFTKSYSPRMILLLDSIGLAVKHFPFGTGFGTFGSSMAADHYSILYTELGYEAYWGMQSDNNLFLSDDFWPIIIAQFGVIGLLLFIKIVYYFFSFSFKKLKSDNQENNNAGFAMLLIMVNIIISSIAETAFFNPTALLFFSLFGACEAETEIMSTQIKKG